MWVLTQHRNIIYSPQMSSSFGCWISGILLSKCNQQFSLVIRLSSQSSWSDGRKQEFFSQLKIGQDKQQLGSGLKSSKFQSVNWPSQTLHLFRHSHSHYFLYGINYTVCIVYVSSGPEMSNHRMCVLQCNIFKKIIGE